MGIYCRPSIKYDDINVLLYKALRKISRSIALGLTDDFNFLELNLGLSYVIHKQVRKFLKHVEDNVLMKILRQQKRKRVKPVWQAVTSNVP